MKPTKEQWKEIEGKLQCLWTPVKLRCDGYEVYLTLVRVNQFKNAIRVYVDGYFRGIWMSSDSEEGRRFYPTRTRRVYSKEKVKRIVKVYGKRAAAKHFDLDTVITWKSPCWGSFGALKRHFIKHNDSIEWIAADETGRVVEIEEAK